MRVIFILIACSILYSNLTLTEAFDDNFQLELVQALFRHGDRIPDKVEVYKTDPYNPDYYTEYGYGQLTKVGMKREYVLGQMLRQRYDDFLGDYNVDEIYGFSTEYDRTKMSLQLVLNGLYPPTQKMRWSNHIDWFPIPTYYDPFETNFLSLDVLAKCSDQLKKLMDEAEELPEVVEKLKQYADVIEYVKNKTEITSSRVIPVALVASNLHAILNMGLPLPEWCTPPVWEKLNEIYNFLYELIAYTNPIRKISNGPFLARMLENVNSSESGENKKKIYLYSAHDINVGAFTKTHNFTGIPGAPAFGSAVIIEKLRGTDNQVYLRILYWTGEGEELIPVKLKNCANECLLSDYVEIMSPDMPDPGYTKCNTCTACS